MTSASADPNDDGYANSVAPLSTKPGEGPLVGMLAAGQAALHTLRTIERCVTDQLQQHLIRSTAHGLEEAVEQVQQESEAAQRHQGRDALAGEHLVVDEQHEHGAGQHQDVADEADGADADERGAEGADGFLELAAGSVAGAVGHCRGPLSCVWRAVRR